MQFLILFVAHFSKRPYLGGKFGITSRMKRDRGLNGSGAEHAFETQMTQVHMSHVSG